MVTMAIFGLAFGAVGIKLVDATVMSQGGDTGLAQAASAHAIPASRADIVDRNGVLLASSLATASLHADPKLIINPVEATRKLVSVLPGLDYNDTLAKLKSDKRFVWISRNLNPREHYEVNRLGIPGIYFQREERRVYPTANLTAHVVGFTGVDNSGLMGIEQSFDKQLRASSRTGAALDRRPPAAHPEARSCQAAVDEFQGARRRRHGHGREDRRGPGDGLAAGLRSQRPRPATRTRGSTAPRSASTRWARPSRSSTRRWRSTPASPHGDSFDATKPIRIGALHRSATTTASTAG